MIVRLLFATVFATAVSVALWAGASALVEPAPFLDETPSVVRASQVQLCVDCEDGEMVPPPPPPTDCDGWYCYAPSMKGTMTSREAVLVRFGTTGYPHNCGTGDATVQVELRIASDGRVSRALVRETTDPCFSPMALQAVQRYYYAASDYEPRTQTVTIMFRGFRPIVDPTY